MYDCQEIAAKADICVSDSDSPRRYHWVRYSGGVTLGQTDLPGSCHRVTVSRARVMVSRVRVMVSRVRVLVSHVRVTVSRVTAP